MGKKILLCLLLGCGMLQGIEESLRTHKFTMEPISYYDYPYDEVIKLQNIESEFTITKESLQKWDQALIKLIKEKNLSEENMYRLYAYVYTAQRDAAFVSYSVNKNFKGSLDKLTLQVIHLFFPYYSPPFPLEEDLYSLQLSEIVFPNFKSRFLHENKNIFVHFYLTNSFYWTGQSTEYSPLAEKWTPWVISPTLSEEKQLTPPPPKDREKWEKEVEALKKEQNKGAYTLPGVGIRKSHQQTPEHNNWLFFANHYLFTHDIPLRKILLTRSLLSIALYDAIIATTEAKYLYGMPHPETQATPNALSMDISLAYSAAAILTYYFPDEEEKWKELAEKIAYTRLKEGINYPLDLAIPKERQQNAVNE